ncbi:MAG: glycosyltransferase [Thermoplasmata archaeon]|nr:MAG: glycosyltransferase [Thermoplasmata archaeon]
MISIILTSEKIMHSLSKLLNKDECEFLVVGIENDIIGGENVRGIKDGNLSTALIKCFEESKGDSIAVINDDVENVENCIKEMVKKVENGADIVVGKRNRKSRLAKMAVNLLFPKSRVVRDPLSETFVFRKKVIEKTNLHPVGNKILLEILARGKYERIEEVPIRVKRKKSKENYRAYSRHLMKMAWKEGEIARFIKFGLVSGSGLLLNEFLLWVFLKLKFALIPAGILSVESAILWTFLMNDIWTFRDRSKEKRESYIKRLTKFNLASLFGLILNVSLLFVLSEWMHPLKANIIGMAVAFTWNFLAHNLWTWYR